MTRPLGIAALDDKIVQAALVCDPDADIRSFFDTVSHDWLIKFVEHRIGEKRVIRLIQNWLKAGVLEDGHEIETTQGTIGEQERCLVTVLRRYFALPTNGPSLSAFRQQVKERWLNVKRGRSQRHSPMWERMQTVVDRHLYRPRILHPWPEQRIHVTHLA